MRLEATDTICRESPNPRTQFVRKEIKLRVNIELNVPIEIHLEVNRERDIERPPGRDVIHLVAGERPPPFFVLLKTLDVEKVLMEGCLRALDGLTMRLVVRCPFEFECVVPIRSR